MPKYWVTINGCMASDAKSYDEAVKEAKQFGILYCGFTVAEIGVDVNENGWPIKRDKDGNVTT